MTEMAKRAKELFQEGLRMIRSEARRLEQPKSSQPWRYIEFKSLVFIVEVHQ